MSSLPKQLAVKSGNNKNKKRSSNSRTKKFAEPHDDNSPQLHQSQGSSTPVLRPSTVREQEGRGKTHMQLHEYDGKMSGTGIPFYYSRDRMIDEFAKYVIVDELPFNHGESDALEHFNKTALQPEYRKVPGNTLKRHTQKAFKVYRDYLIEYFRTFDGRISITIDIWTSCFGESFMCVAAHWTDIDWNLQKRIIAFEFVQGSRPSGSSIKPRVVDCLRKYHLLDKVFLVSLDNSIADTKALYYFKYENAFKFVVDGQFLHVRRCAHLLNLCVQEGIAYLQPLLEPIRSIIKLLRTGKLKRKYIAMCKEMGLPKKIWYLDTPNHWRSTYKLLNDAIKYREILTSLYNNDVIDQDCLIVDKHWHVATLVHEILESFDHALNIFSLIYEPNINLVIPQCVNVVHVISKTHDVEAIKVALDSMKAKWFANYSEFPYIYGIATILDPDIQVYGLRQLLIYYYQSFGIHDDVETYVLKCKHLLEQLYDHYASIYKSNVASSSSSASNSRFDSLITTILKKQKTTSARKDLDEYLSLRFYGGKNFDILKWWRNHEDQYPILARIAKDVLAIPASTSVSESAFSACGKVLDEKRSRLPPKSIEICVCKRDWDRAEKRTQGKKDDENDEQDPWMQMETDSNDSSLKGEQSNEEED